MRLYSSEYDQKVKRAAQNLLDFEAQCRATGESMNTLSKENLEYVRNLGQMQTVSKNVRGRISELSSAFTELSMQYKRLSDEEKKGEIGKALTASIDQLKGRITTLKTDLGDVNKELGDTATSSQGVTSILDTLGQKFGVTANLTDLLTSKTAMLTGVIGAMATGVVAATKEWAAYNDELAKQDQQTAVITGLKGSDSNNMTDSARALASVYNVDFRQAIDAANTLMTQFGESGDSAMQILRDGMQGMLQGDGGKLLQMIQQYAPAFHDAGVSASQLVAVIQNSEGGIFTAENMSAIVMGIKNIRLMTNQTREALAKMGIDGEEMSKKMSDGSMTIFDALKQVASKLKDTEAGSKTAGEVMQSVFGRQGAMAGTNLAKAIESLNTNLEETKNQTGEVGQATADLQKATEQLNKAIRDCFEYDGWDVMKTELQTGLVVALATVVEKLGDAKRYLTELEVAGVNVFDTIRTSALNALGPLGKVLNLLIDINNAKSGEKAGAASEYGGALSGALLGGGTDDVVLPLPPANPPKSNPEDLITGGIKGLSEIQGAGLSAYQSMAALTQQMADYKNALAEANNMLDEMLARKGIADTQWQMSDTGRAAARIGWDRADLEAVNKDMQDAIGELEPLKIKATVDIDSNAIKRTAKDASNVTTAFQAAAISADALAVALRNFDDPTMRIVSIIAEAIANVASGAGSAIAKAGQESASWIDYLAASTSVTAQMITTIAEIRSATKYAQGGIIKGNSYSGDNILAQGPSGLIGLNAGEVVLTKAMQGNLASQLSESGGGGVAMRPYVDSERIYLGMDNMLTRRGKGEIVTTSMLRKLKLI